MARLNMRSLLDSLNDEVVSIECGIQVAPISHMSR